MVNPTHRPKPTTPTQTMIDKRPAPRAAAGGAAASSHLAIPRMVTKWKTNMFRPAPAISANFIWNARFPA